MLLSFQIFMFGLFASLFAVKLNLLKSKFIELFFKIFKLRYAFYLTFIFLLIFSSINIFKDELGFNILTIQIFKYSISLFTALLILNSLYVSLITLDENS